MRARGWSIGAACAAVLAACAHDPGKLPLAAVGWVEPSEPVEPPPPPVKEVAPRAAPPRPPDGPPIDAALLPFAAEARARRARSAAGRGFPGEAVAAWEGLARELDRYLDRHLARTPLLELARARVTVESELEFDRRRYGEAPAAVLAALRPRLAQLAERVEASRALGGRLFAQGRPPALRWPVEGAGLSSGFGMRPHPLDGQRRMHWGIDLAAAPGRVVGAAAGGYVVHAGWMAGYGWLVEVRHAGELTSRYSHLSRILCRAGDAVEPGQVLGLVGQSGRTTGPHLHFEVWEGGRARDPLALLGLQVAQGAAGD